MAAITPEKLNELMLKVRKGATASFTIAQITAILEAIGGSVKPAVGLITVDDHGGWKKSGEPYEVWFRSNEERDKAFQDLQKYIVSSLPSKPKPGMLYVQNLEKAEDKGYGAPMPGLRLTSHMGGVGIEVHTPDGKSETIFPARARNLSDLLKNGLKKPVLQNYDVLKFLAKTDWIARVNQFLNTEEHVPGAQRTREGTGSCPVCFQNIKMSSEKMVLHGYQRPGYGEIHGKCFGVGYPAFEISVKGVVAYLDHMIIPALTRLQARLNGLKSGDVKQLIIGNARKVITPESPNWDSYLKDEIKDTERNLKAAEEDKKAYTNLKTHWVERPLPKEGEMDKNWFYAGQKASGPVKLAALFLLPGRVASRFLESLK